MINELPADMCIRPAFFDDRGTWTYRYWLRRDLRGPPRPLLGILANPSTAGYVKDDATSTIMAGFAGRWGFGILALVNLKAIVQTDSRKVTALPHEVGPLNDAAIAMALDWVDGMDGQIVTAWGCQPALKHRAWEVLRMLNGRTVLRFGRTRDGSPRFPRAIRGDTRPERWTIKIEDPQCPKSDTSTKRLGTRP